MVSLLAGSSGILAPTICCGQVSRGRGPTASIERLDWRVHRNAQVHCEGISTELVENASIICWSLQKRAKTAAARPFSNATLPVICQLHMRDGALASACGLWCRNHFRVRSDHVHIAHYARRIETMAGATERFRAYRYRRAGVFSDKPLAESAKRVRLRG